MKVYLAAAICCIIGATHHSAAAQEKTGHIRWSSDDNHIALLRADTIIWQLNINAAEDKPYFHPLCTPSGVDLTLGRPADHPWHRGLWFSWKDINGVNYWEEDVNTGLSEGRSLVKNVKSRLKKDFSAKISLEISYADREGPVMREKRILHISPALEAPGYSITWQHVFTPLKDLRLYLEKPAKHGGVNWGGYAGLSFRGAATLAEPVFTASNGWTNVKDITGYGEKANWMDVTAKAGKRSGLFAGITIFDHPDNARYPSPWYIWYTSGKHLFFTPSLLFDGPLYLNKGQKLTLKYLTYVHDGELSFAELDNLSTQFIK